MSVLAALWLSLASAVSITGRAQESGLPGFEPATPESQGLAPARLEELCGVVQGFVEAGAIVGAELCVIKNDRNVLHRGFGWKHREEEVPMEPGGIFCVRSMTKAVVGTAVQLLIDEESLAESDRVAEHLPSFDYERSRSITIEQLLTHTGGLPLSGLLGKDVGALRSLREIADAAGEKGPELPPGERFHYSDDGADVLGALVELASGMELAPFLEERLFTPLGMRETLPVVTSDHPLRERVCSNYAGGPGAWTRYWSPEDPPLFPILLASQGLYCSVLDYARFLHAWKEVGRAGGERLFSRRAVRHALAPGRPMSFPTGFAGLERHYGQMMTLWVEAASGASSPGDAGDEDAPGGEARLVAFGHGGSDGTYSWVFPDLDLLVLYFTQSRNSASGIDLEADIQRLLLDPLLGTVRAPLASYTEGELEAFTGIYWEEDDGEYDAVLRRNGTLMLEVPGKAVRELKATSVRDRFEVKRSPGTGLEFERDEEGAVVSARAFRPGVSEPLPRLVPAADLPSLEELLARKKEVCDWERLDELGPLRIRSTLELPAVAIRGTGETLVEGAARMRAEYDYGSYREKLVLDGGRGWSWSSSAGLEVLDEARLAEMRLEHPLVPVADWRAQYRLIRVLARIEHDGEPALLVRAEPGQGNAHTWILAEDGRPLALQAVTQVPGLGELGSVTEYRDWREVGSLRLPFHRTGSFASRILGDFDVRWESVETGVELPDGAFSLEEEAPPAREGR